MKFKANSRRRALEYEKAILDFWKENKVFEQSVERRSPDNAYVFYDGPPFITGVPHHGTLLSSIIKDVVPRYWTMQGRRVERVWGWDCHGLPAENFVEKQLNIVDRRQIIVHADDPAPLDKDGNALPTISLETYITKARESMVANSETWQGVIDRIGRWVDFKGAYRTMDKDFMESVWWAFKQLYEAGKIYEGEKVLMYDTKFATPVSKAEVTMDNDAYQTVTDPSVYVKFKLLSDSADVYILAWSTTPWTLPANLMLAVNSELTYAEVLVDGERLILAKNAIEQVLTDEKHQPLTYELIREFPGSELAGRAYQPLDTGSTWPNHPAVHKIYSADFVASDSGTGIVHIAPAYGEDDFALAKQHGVSAFHVIDDNGYYFDSKYKGLEVWDNNKFIAKDLKEKGIVWKIDYIRHEYPFNPRSKQRIMYRAIPSWFMDIEHQKPLMLEENEHINWFPAHLKHGRFAKNIEQAPDWNLSRDRFWATAMPVWKSPSGKVKVIGSYAELEELSGVKLDDYHRPWVDEITFEIDGETYTRIDKVLDCWFESGSMPFAQLHYPFDNKEKFEQNYPADFIVEYVGQVRAWFYYVHAVNTALAEIGAFGDNIKHKNAFKNVITTGVVAGNDGRKMSKSLGNFTDPNELMDKFSADSLRFLLIQSPLLNGEDFALLDKDVADVARKLTMIWNMYDFFTMYAEVDDWEFDGQLIDPLTIDLKNPLDRWVVSRLHQLRNQITDNMNVYDIPHAVEDVLLFIDDASNWFVRRSRRRFWKGEDDTDKNQAYQTLHYVLSYLALILAPFVPFLSEELWQKMVGSESVHLQDWPEAGQIDERIVADMAELRGFVNEALALRAKAGIKIRQPLAEVVLPRSADGVEWFSDILLEELNVKRVSWQAEAPVIALDFTITSDLRNEGLAREVIRAVQNARKKAGLNIDDRINLAMTTENSELKRAIEQFQNEINQETLAISNQVSTKADDEIVEIEKIKLVLKLEKA
ncbi:MAG: isoleucine--tRNA ligase, partial [Candidatus Saccharibacteria bacterium]|nr:isoleucine--tRNA ligase [Candidatus Saccharibacteria bacterium]